MWSIERLASGEYGLVKTMGQESRTVFIASKASDAADFLAMAETYALLQAGTPVEVFKEKFDGTKVQPKKRSSEGRQRKATSNGVGRKRAG